MNQRPQVRTVRGMKKLLVITGLLAMALAGCQRVIVVQGYYRPGWESSQFVRCGHKTGWWLDGNADFYERYGRIKAANPGGVLPGNPVPSGPDVYVRARGVLYGPGRYGHVGGWSYRFEVKEVEEMRLARPEERE
jgi:hypothetical protein